MTYANKTIEPSLGFSFGGGSKKGKVRCCGKESCRVTRCQNNNKFELWRLSMATPPVPVLKLAAVLIRIQPFRKMEVRRGRGREREGAEFPLICDTGHDVFSLSCIIRNHSETLLTIKSFVWTTVGWEAHLEEEIGGTH